MHMSISIHEAEVDAGGREGKGFTVSVSSQSGKKTVNETDFFRDGCEIAALVQQLQNLLKKHFAGAVADA